MTYQRPAYEQVMLKHDTFVVTLRPSLRAATILEQRYGLPTLFKALDEANFSIINDIILTAGTDWQQATTFLLVNNKRPLLSLFADVSGPVSELVAMLTPAPDPKAQPSTGTGKPMPWSEVFATLYDSATGWLGWTPETAWNATPTEITRAMSAHFDRLVTTGVLVPDKTTAKAPDPEQAARNVADGLDPEFDRAGLRALKAKISQGN